jgi:enediyne biosynthesis protein E7
MVGKDALAAAKIGRGLPVIGALPRLLADPAKLAADLMHATDDVVPLRLGPVTIWFVHHPDHLRHIMLDNYKNYSKGPLFARADLLVGNGLVVNHGESWRRQRRLMQPPFANHRLAAIVPTFAAVAADRLATWKTAKQPIEMWHEMTAITMSALLKTMFGMDIDDDLIRRFDRAFDLVGRHVALRGPTFFLPEWFPLPGRKDALAATDELHAIIDGIIAERRKRVDSGKDLLGLMIAARDDDGSGMTETQLRDEIKTSVFAGYDSTATGLAWTWYLLATHPESARRARAEVLDVMPEGMPTAEQLGKLDYLGRCFHEALRLYPPLSFHPRMAIEADTIGTQRIPAGATLIYSNYAPNRNPAFWEHPDSFNPDHFLPDRIAARHKFAYQPFGAGPRVCIGATMAALEAKTVLALGLRDYELVRPVNTPSMQARFGTTRAKGGIWIEMRPRSGSERAAAPPEDRARSAHP